MEQTLYASQLYHGDGVASSFAFPWRIWQLADLRVVRVDVASGVETLLQAGVDYSVPAAAIGIAGGGSLTLLGGPLATTDDLLLESNVAPVQTTSFRAQIRFLANTLESAVDKLTRLVQQLTARLGVRGELAATTAYVQSYVAATAAAGALPSYTILTRPAASAAWHGKLIRVKDPGQPEQVCCCLLQSDDLTYEWGVLYAGGF